MVACRCFLVLATLLTERSLAMRKIVSSSKMLANSTAHSEGEWYLGWRRPPLPPPPFHDNRLRVPSSAQTLNFYMYRSEGPEQKDNYPLVNVNAASIGGVLWYLHHEIIFTCDGAGGILGSRVGGSGIIGQRKFGITRIKRIKVQMKATQPLLERGMNFSVLCSYDAGRCSGPFRESGPTPEFRQFGYTVGCARVGDWPHENWPSGKKYPNAIWYSLPGPCPSMDYMSRTEVCSQQNPGGRCPAGRMPDGTAHCTYQYEDAGEIDLDELVGITPKWKDRAEFCKECGTEGSDLQPGGCGLDFWGKNVNDEVSAHKQVEAALDMFEKKYPDSPKRHEMPDQCDWNHEAYWARPWHGPDAGN